MAAQPDLELLGFCDIIIKESKTAIPGFVPFFSRCSCRCSNSALCKQRMHNAQVHCPTIGLWAGTDRNIQKKTVWFTDISHAVFFCAYMGNAHSPIHINAQPPIRSQNAHTRAMHTHIYVIMHSTLYAMHTHIYAAVRRLIQNFARPPIRYNAQPPIRKMHGHIYGFARVTIRHRDSFVLIYVFQVRDSFSMFTILSKNKVKTLKSVTYATKPHKIVYTAFSFLGMVLY